jgi:peptidyl-prolyl cis-trans isomerase C
MKFRMIFFVLISFLSFYPPIAFSKDKVVTSVNGAVIPETTIDDALKLATQAGQESTPKLRQLIVDQLIAREVLFQESIKLGLDKTPQAQKALAEIRKNYLISSLFNQHLSKNPISDAMIKDEYDRQAKLLAQTPKKEYKISEITLASEVDAQSALSRIKNNESFDKVAREKSIDPSKNKGGDIGWVTTDRLIPAIATAVPSMGRGTLSPVIKSKIGWHIVKIEDERNYKMPALEESKNQMRQFLMQEARVKYANKLKESAKISSQ